MLSQHASHRSLHVCGEVSKAVSEDQSRGPYILTMHWLHVWVWLRLKLDILDGALGIDAGKGALVAHLVDVVARAEDGDREALWVEKKMTST